MLVQCASTTDDLCNQEGDCAQGGDSIFIAHCKTETSNLETEASGDGCGGAFESYFSCADSSFVCNGATPAFPGCDAKHAALDACLTAAQAKTHCAKLTAATGACADAGANGATTPLACTANRDCTSQCYLDSVANVCAPRTDELQTASSCFASCPP